MHNKTSWLLIDRRLKENWGTGWLFFQKCTKAGFYLKKWTAGFANPESVKEPAVPNSSVFSSQAFNTSSASIPWRTLSKWPVSICQMYTVPSEQPTIKKSSYGRHLIFVTGNKCLFCFYFKIRIIIGNCFQKFRKQYLLAKVIHLRSCKLSKATEWSDATEHMHFWIRG